MCTGEKTKPLHVHKEKNQKPLLVYKERNQKPLLVHKEKKNSVVNKMFTTLVYKRCLQDVNNHVYNLCLQNLCTRSKHPLCTPLVHKLCAQEYAPTKKQYKSNTNNIHGMYK